MDVMHPSGTTFLTDSQKGLISSFEAIKYFMFRGWEASNPTDPCSPYDLVVRHPRTNEIKTVQIKTVDKRKRTIKPYGSGKGADKGGRRKKTDYGEIGIDYVIGIEIGTSKAYLYPREFYKSRSSINVDKNPGVDIEFVKERNYKHYKKNQEKIVSLDLCYGT